MCRPGGGGGGGGGGVGTRYVILIRDDSPPGGAGIRAHHLQEDACSGRRRPDRWTHCHCWDLAQSAL